MTKEENWKVIVDYLKSSHCKDVHKIYDSINGWGYLSDKFGRYRICDTDSLQVVIYIIHNIKINLNN